MYVNEKETNIPVRSFNTRILREPSNSDWVLLVLKLLT
jgi:hypothetical protein